MNKSALSVNSYLSAPPSRLGPLSTGLKGNTRFQIVIRNLSFFLRVKLSMLRVV